jgi:hypothetical protein
VASTATGPVAVNTGPRPMQYLWAVSGSGATQINEADGIALDSQTNLYASGVFNGTATIADQVLTSAGAGDIFVMKVSAAGELVWMRQYGGSGNDNTFDVVSDRSTDNLILSGQFTGTLDFGGGIALTSFGGSDQFVAAMSSDGNVLWAEHFGSTSEDGGNEVTVVTDLSGNIIASAVSLGNYRAGDLTFVNHGNRDSYIQKLSSTGDVLWVKGTTGSGYEQIRAVGTDPSGAVYGGYEFRGRFGIEGVSYNAGLLAMDGALVKWDGDGNFLWSKTVSGAGDGNVKGIATGPVGTIYVCGDFSNTASIFGRTATAMGQTDNYLARLNASDGSVQ